MSGKSRAAARGVAIAALMLLAVAPAGAQSPDAAMLLQEAIHLEEAIGDAARAILAYERALGAATGDTELAASAELRLALLLARAGELERARNHHRRIVETHGDDPRLEAIVRRSRAALGSETAETHARGMVARRLWDGTQAYGYGSLAADGSFIAYVDWASGNLAVHDLDRGTQRFLTTLDPRVSPQTWACSTAVSPDGRQIAYTWYTHQRGHEVRVVDRDGSEPRILLEAGRQPRHLELEGWTADGETLLLLEYGAGGRNRFLTLPAGGGSASATLELGARFPEHASISPDGRWIAYYEVTGETRSNDVIVSAVDGSFSSAVVAHPSNDLLPLWTPDGGHLLFVSDRTGTTGAWVVEVRAGRAVAEPLLVRPDFGRSMPIGFTDAREFVYALQTSVSDIFTSRLGAVGGEGLRDRQLSSGRYVGINRSPSWSPDGLRLAYLSDRSPLPAGIGPASIVVREPATGEERVLSPDLRKIYEPRWHPGGEALLVTGIDHDDGWGIHRIDVDSGAVEPFLSWGAEQCDCAFPISVAARGSAMAYFRPLSAAGTGNLVVRDTAAETERIVAAGVSANDLHSFELSPDGTRLAAVVRAQGVRSADDWQLVVYEEGVARETRSLGGDSVRIGLVGWADDRAVIALALDGGLRVLQRIDADSGAATTLVPRLDDDVHGIRLHPDGDRIAFGAGQSRVEVWMIENLLADLVETVETGSR